MKKFFLLIASLIVMSGFVEYSTSFSMKRYKVSTCDTTILRGREKFEDSTCPCCVQTQRILKFNVENITRSQQRIEKVKVFHGDDLIHQENFDCDLLIFEAKQKQELTSFLKEKVISLGLEPPGFTLTIELFYEEGMSENHNINYVYCN